MVKSRAAPPKWSFHVVTWNGKDRYTLIEQSAHVNIWLYDQSIATAVNNICI